MRKTDFDNFKKRNIINMTSPASSALFSKTPSKLLKPKESFDFFDWNNNGKISYGSLQVILLNNLRTASSIMYQHMRHIHYKYGGDCLRLFLRFKLWKCLFRIFFKNQKAMRRAGRNPTDVEVTFLRLIQILMEF